MDETEILQSIRAGLELCARELADERDNLDLLSVRMRRLRRERDDAQRAAQQEGQPRGYWACWQEGARQMRERMQRERGE